MFLIGWVGMVILVLPLAGTLGKEFNAGLTHKDLLLLYSKCECHCHIMCEN